MTREEMMTDGTQYCCYCGDEKVRFSCCGENHFQTFAQMDKDEQDEFLKAELVQRAEDAFNRSKWVGLTDEQIHNTAGYQETREMYSFARAIEAKLKEKNNG